MGKEITLKLGLFLKIFYLYVSTYIVYTYICRNLLTIV
jgi:hypothetical protein